MVAVTRKPFSVSPFAASWDVVAGFFDLLADFLGCVADFPFRPALQVLCLWQADSATSNAPLIKAALRGCSGFISDIPWQSTIAQRERACRSLPLRAGQDNGRRADRVGQAHRTPIIHPSIADLVADDTTDGRAANVPIALPLVSTAPPTAPTPAPMAVLLSCADMPAQPPNHGKSRRQKRLSTVWRGGAGETEYQ